jgi:hypothetical protein
MNVRHNQVSMRKADRREHRAAYSLLEVVLASAISASALVPALALLRDGVTMADDISARHQLLLYSVSKMEEQMAGVAASWSEGTVSGDFAAEGHAHFRYTVSRSDSSASGGINQRLMSIAVTTYRDDDGDDALDANEMRIAVTTKISKLPSYENKASS